MWPWLAGAGVLALLAVSSSGKVVARTPLPAGASQAHPTTTSRNVPLTVANITAAQQVALAKETNITNLNSFGNALITYGYPTLGHPLLAKAALGGSGLSKAAVESQQATTSQSFATMINHYTGSDYKSGDSFSRTDVRDAVHNAIATATTADIGALQAFAVALQHASANSEAKEVFAAIAALKAGRAPVVPPLAPGNAASQVSQSAAAEAVLRAIPK